MGCRARCAALNSFFREKVSFRMRFGTILIAALLVVIACSSNRKSDSPTSSDQATVPSSDQPWPVRMQALSNTLSELLPLVVSRSKFNNASNFAKIETETRKLRSLAHSLKMGETPNADPNMKIMGGLFEEDIERALDALKVGSREYARQILKNTTSYCIQCHTQTGTGPEFPRLDLSLNTDELTYHEQAEFFAATRQFDRAIEAYGKSLNDPNLAKFDPFEWEQTARAALAIFVRVKNDPDAAGKWLNRIRSHASLPDSIRSSLQHWRRSIQDWRREKKPENLDTPEKAIARAEELIKTAQKRQEFPMDHTQDVYFFRASRILHQFLENYGPRHELSAKALYLSGVAAEATRDMNFWTLHETYYEYCIRVKPHSEQAQKCFQRLNDSVTLGYSGSGGVRIPPEVNKRLETFRTMAAPIKTEEN